MKKTEKIEVRVSAEEKERLNELAETRNQNISELIRDRMAGNYTLPAQSFSRDIMWNRAISAVALAFASVALIWGILGLMRDAPASPPPAMSTVLLYTAETFPPVLETQVAHRSGFEQTYVVKTKAGEFRTTHKVIEMDEGIFQLTVNMCRLEVKGCPIVDEAVLILSPPSAYPRQGNAMLHEGGILTFKVVTRAASLPKPEKEA